MSEKWQAVAVYRDPAVSEDQLLLAPEYVMTAHDASLSWLRFSTVVTGGTFEEADDAARRALRDCEVMLGIASRPVSFLVRTEEEALREYSFQESVLL